MQTVSIVGIGRVGGALALALDQKGYKIEKLIARNDINAKKVAANLKSKSEIHFLAEDFNINSEVVFICTQDSEISGICRQLLDKIKVNSFVFHTSGALSSEVLSDLSKIGCKIASIHPLISISDSFLGVSHFANAFFCVEGETDANNFAKKLVTDLEGNFFTVETSYKTLYHAAAVTACGHLVATIDTAIEMLEKCGIEELQAKNILMPLIKSTIENIEIQTTASALTGTFARADVETFDKHLATIDKNISNEIKEIYLLLGLRSLGLAEKQGADINKTESIRKKILLAKNNLK